MYFLLIILLFIRLTVCIALAVLLFSHDTIFAFISVLHILSFYLISFFVLIL